MTGRRRVVLYGRRGCHLCDEARAVIQRVGRTHPFDYAERDIEESEDLLRLYLERIPVVTIDGVESFDLFVDEAGFTAAVTANMGTRVRHRS